MKTRFSWPALWLCAAAALSAQTVFQQTNLVADLAGHAAHTDPHLVNPWGISYSATSPFWVSDAGTGVSTLYNSTGTPSALVVTIPGGGGHPGVPTGQVFNPDAASNVFQRDAFIFASETGTIDGWRGALGTSAEILVDNSGAGASYAGLALGVVGGRSYLYAANFGQGQIDVVPDAGAPALSGAFADPTLPAGYSPFNIQRLGTNLFVTYALQDAGGDEIKGPGLGLVNEYDLSGNLVRRFATGGALNAPWGLAIAPAAFREYGNTVLVGNFGDGTINAFDAVSGTLIGPLKDRFGNPLANDGLWGIIPGNGGSGGSAKQLYFAAGGADESHGLFGTISAVPEGGATALLLFIGLMALRLPALHARRRRAV